MSKVRVMSEGIVMSEGFQTMKISYAKIYIRTLNINREQYYL